jgi:UDP-N-acetylglucosamine--N-acetylmuramyl-(pentapeptide) pyrophosphoryl-undecaprenol N-acetylglucosamine transferase
MSERTVYFAGGGSGGHIFPNMAVLERLRERSFQGKAIFCVSDRALDAQIISAMSDDNVTALPLVVRPWTSKPWRWPRFLSAWRSSVLAIKSALAENPGLVISTGGFVSGPPIVAASKLGMPAALVSLDAVPGRANCRIARNASDIFSTYETTALKGALPLGLPLRRSAVGALSVAESRASFELAPDRSTILVCGGSQGAQSVNNAVVQMFKNANESEDVACRFLRNCQVLHITGQGKDEAIREGYAKLNVLAKVIPFCDRMGDAWRSATFAISRSGAGSVAEAWANRVPTIFLPYPFHRDDHQKHNAQAIVEAGGGVVLTDQIDPDSNAAALLRATKEHFGDTKMAGQSGNEQLGQNSLSVHKLEQMQAALAGNCPPDGADILAKWVLESLA